MRSMRAPAGFEGVWTRGKPRDELSLLLHRSLSLLIPWHRNQHTSNSRRLQCHRTLGLARRSGTCLCRLDNLVKSTR